MSFRTTSGLILITLTALFIAACSNSDAVDGGADAGSSDAADAGDAAADAGSSAADAG